MKTEWNLDILYKGLDDQHYIDDIKKMENLSGELRKLLDEACKLSEVEKTEKLLLALEEEMRLFYRAAIFVNLNLAVDSENGDFMAQRDKILRLQAECTGIDTEISKELGSISDISALANESPLIKEYSFYLEENKEKVSHMLSVGEESMAAAMDVCGGSAWSGFRDYLTSTVKVDYDGKEITLSEVRNLAYDTDENVRKNAYEAEIASYEKIKDSIAFSLNNIKNQVIMLGNKRGFESPLNEALFKSRMSKEALQAMMETIEEYIPRLREFYKSKAKILGNKNGLPWYDLFAPTGKLDMTFTAEECRDYLVETFEKFTPDMSSLMKEAFDNEWVDFYPRNGKQGGAFDEELLGFGQSRVLTNFDGSFSSVDTLAHELGHSFHDRQVRDERLLNHRYSMPIAETASTFNETFLFENALKDATDEEKISLLDSSLSEKLQCVIDITSRFIFEKTVFEQCADKFLMAEDLNKIMLDAQDKTYGDALDPEFKHPYMWACKSHYYIPELSFYNFPYAFGLLFSMGLYAMYKTEGQSFVEKYEEMLRKTGTCSIEECGNVMGVDLTKHDFWKASLEIILKDVNEYTELVNKTLSK